ncbi:MAG: hypothetical protein PHX51_00225 [Clostridia bacterium]|nr:hypothetical protein [Clostridia bacterium]
MRKVSIQKNQLKRMRSVLSQDKRNQNIETVDSLRCELAILINKYAKLLPKGLTMDISEQQSGVRISVTANCGALKTVK